MERALHHIMLGLRVSWRLSVGGTAAEPTASMHGRDGPPREEVVRATVKKHRACHGHACRSPWRQPLDRKCS